MKLKLCSGVKWRRMFSMAFKGGFKDGESNDCDQASDGCVQSVDCDQASDGCFQSDDCDQASDGCVDIGDGCDLPSDGCVQSDDCDQPEAWLQPSPEVLMVVLTLVMIVSCDCDLPGAKVELAVREWHCQVGAEEASLPCHHTIRKY